MKIFLALLALAISASVVGCRKESAKAMPPPAPLTANAVGHYCGMNLTEHEGPKGQILLASREEPVWFSSARDALSFTMLPEEPKDIRAIYVSDMGKAASWKDPGRNNWIDARKALFVIDSRMKGGMGAAEAVPFAEKDAAARFAADNGGRVVTFDEMPRAYILESPEAAPPPQPHRH